MSKVFGALEAWKKGEVEIAPVTRLLGVSLLDYDIGEAKVGMEVGPQHHNPMGTVHGGILCDLADVAFGTAFISSLEEGQALATLELQIHYFRPVKSGYLTAYAWTVRKGQTSGYLECEIRDENHRFIAKVSSTCMIVKKANQEQTA